MRRETQARSWSSKMVRHIGQLLDDLSYDKYVDYYHPRDGGALAVAVPVGSIGQQRMEMCLCGSGALATHRALAQNCPEDITRAVHTVSRSFDRVDRPCDCARCWNLHEPDSVAPLVCARHAKHCVASAGAQDTSPLYDISFVACPVCLTPRTALFLNCLANGWPEDSSIDVYEPFKTPSHLDQRTHNIVTARDCGSGGGGVSLKWATKAVRAILPSP
ncbi:hypothetical protein ml_317 [Mollivirus sibericum]|uniref:hypothetical protein n=1 Tax=Mollivirus sibericum TaxID=1678078 RepID=UPI0006B2E09E|nr:hypothetical protein ml_317 [Mollivirus sibericum]ALD62119.1 hypothetical protein ml_317 [Mollivirus sibericum]